MKLYKDGVDIGGSDVTLDDVLTMTIQLDSEYLSAFSVSKLITFKAISIDIK